MVTFVKTEWHSVASRFTYEIDDDQIEEIFGSVERFKEILSWQEQEPFNRKEPIGEEPTEEEEDAFFELMCDSDYERDDDWWTERKGGYDITFSGE